MALPRGAKARAAVVVDRLVAGPDILSRVTDSVETALRLSGGLVTLEFVDLPEDDPQRERMFSEHLACLYDDLSFEELEPRSFSFNSPFGACPDCTGLGTRREVDEELLVPDPDKSLAEGAIAPWADSSGQYYQQTLESIARHYKVKMSTPWKELPKKVRDAILRDGTRDSGCGLKAFRRDVFLSLPYFDGLHRFLPALVRREGYDIVFVDVVDRPRLSGVSNYGFFDRLWVGLMDLAGVWWLIRRKKATPVATEVN